MSGVEGCRPPKLAVIVMGYRDASTIATAVQSVIAQEATEPFEVLVVTSGGDDSAAIVRARFPEVRVLESSERLLPGGARNLGINATDAEIVSFLAGDCIALPGWIEGRLAHHRQGRSAVASAIVPGPNDSTAGVAGGYLLFPARMPGHAEGAALGPQSFGLSYSRDLLDELGPFDGSLRIGEDSLMLDAVLKRGVAPWFDPAIQTGHPGPRDARALFADQLRRGRLRFAWDVLFTNGRGSRWMASARLPALRALITILLALKHFPRRAWWTIQHSAIGAHDRGALLRAVPLIAVGLVVNQVGWALECFGTSKPTTPRPHEHA